jgi:hypothetical protein
MNTVSAINGGSQGLLAAASFHPKNAAGQRIPGERQANERQAALSGADRPDSFLPEKDGRRAGESKSGSLEAETVKSRLSGDKARSEPAKPVGELDAEERAELRRLQARDARIRAKEMARLGAAGSLALSGARFRFEVGPDGRQYAVDGEVRVDTAYEGDPERNLEKARQLQVTALAGPNLMSTDPALSALARRLALMAYADLARRENLEELHGKPDNGESVLPSDEADQNLI